MSTPDHKPGPLAVLTADGTAVLAEASADAVGEMFVWLDDLRASGLVNMMGASRMLGEAFSLDRGLARTVWAEWARAFALRHGQETP